MTKNMKKLLSNSKKAKRRARFMGLYNTKRIYLARSRELMAKITTYILDDANWKPNILCESLGITSSSINDTMAMMDDWEAFNYAVSNVDRK